MAFQDYELIEDIISFNGYGNIIWGPDNTFLTVTGNNSDDYYLEYYQFNKENNTVTELYKTYNRDDNTVYDYGIADGGVYILYFDSYTYGNDLTFKFVKPGVFSYYLFEDDGDDVPNSVSSFGDRIIMRFGTSFSIYEVGETTLELKKTFSFQTATFEGDLYAADYNHWFYRLDNQIIEFFIDDQYNISEEYFNNFYNEPYLKTYRSLIWDGNGIFILGENQRVYYYLKENNLWVEKFNTYLSGIDYSFSKIAFDAWDGIFIVNYYGRTSTSSYYIRGYYKEYNETGWTAHETLYSLSRSSYDSQVDICAGISRDKHFIINLNGNNSCNLYKAPVSGVNKLKINGVAPTFKLGSTNVSKIIIDGNIVYET